MNKDLIKHTKNYKKDNSKSRNFMIWLLILLLGVFSVLNQKFVVYNSMLLQFLITCVSGFVGIYLLLKKTEQGLNFCEYWCGSVRELKKVTWPNKKETMQTTAAVVIMVIIMGLVLWTVDSVLIRLVAWLLRRGGV